MKKLFLTSLYFIATLISFTAPQAFAQIEPERYTTVTITPKTNDVQAGQTIQIATTIKMAQDWHVYWVNPGDSGLPVNITWDLPTDFKIGDIIWPVPDKITFDILANYGYYDEVILLQDLTLPKNLPEGKIDLRAQVNMLICKDICIPESSEITLSLNNPDILPQNNDHIFTKAQSTGPKKLDGIFTYHEDGQNLILNLSTSDQNLLDAATKGDLEFFPYDYGTLAYAQEPEVTLSNNLITISHKRGDLSMAKFTSIGGVVVIQNGHKSLGGYEIMASLNNSQNKPASASQDAPVTPAQNSEAIINTPDNTSDMTILGALIFAFLGGLILNLMPCVFPVLSMKALSLVKMKEKEAALARKFGLAYTAGVIMSFLAIGGALLIFKVLGLSIGWGFQLQNPIVVALLAYILFAIGLNLIGLFNIGSRFGNIGNRLTQGQGISHSFYTGVLATIVASPCSAPFMGAAMGFAILQPPIIALTIFAALGLGLAFPYLLLSFVPAAQKILPRPGAWMDTFKQFLAFPMFASAIWLIWVLDQQAGSLGILLVLLGMLSITFCVWLVRHQPSGLMGIINHTLFMICMLVPFLSLTYLKTQDTSEMPTALTQQFGETFSSQALDEALNTSDPVFVEMTAAWCLTCKFNHAIALNVDSTKKHFMEKNIRYLIGDWTNYDKEITDFLDTYGRNGVPLYVFYGAPDPKTGKRPDAVILPQVLTATTVQEIVTSP